MYCWKRGPSTYLGKPEVGARLLNWSLRMANNSVRDVLYWSKETSLGDLTSLQCGNSIFFPFCGRSYHKGQKDQWKDQKGIDRTMPENGFAQNGQFELCSLDERGFTAELKPNTANEEHYPFNYRFTIRYVFESIFFKIYLSLENLGDEPILWSAGHRFYFTLPWHRGLERDDYRFQVSAKKCFTQSPDGRLVPAQKGWTDQTSFGNQANNERIYTQLKNDTIIFGPNGGEEDVGISILKDSNTYSKWNCFKVCTKNLDSRYFCVEPCMGPPNCVEHGKGLHAVSGGSTADFGIKIALL